MLYHHLRFFNYIFVIHGLKKPFTNNTEHVSKVTILDRLWTLVILTMIIACYFFFVLNPLSPDIKKNLELICQTNEFIVCSLTMVVYLAQNQRSYKTLYRTINGIVRRFNIQAHYLRKFCWKMYLLSIFPFGASSCLTIWAIYSGNSWHNIVVRIPLFLENIHLLLHICIIIALLKTLNAKLAEKLNLSKNTFFNVGIERSQLFAFQVKPSEREYFATKYFCHVYDDLCQSIKLLEKQHGVQVKSIKVGITKKK